MSSDWATKSNESDAERMERAPERAFAWVMREIEVPDAQAREVLRKAWLRVVHGPYDAAVRVLERVWPQDASWPSGEAYLRRGKPQAQIASDRLMGLLFERLSHVESRMYRDAQVRNAIDPASPYRIPEYTHVMANRHSLRKRMPCGLGANKRMTIEDGLALMREPACTHPACYCTVAPWPV